MTRTITTTADSLARVLYGCSAADLTRGHTYAGTNIPLRKVPADAVVTVRVQANRASAMVSDADGGWIADHLGPALGARQIKKIAALTL